MAERRATNKYYPPEWDPSKGSINKFVGQHPLRERARKLHEGILIVRFELPFSIWCSNCHEHIGKGVRFNAEKKQIGKYFTTKIWNFRMKCHLCSHHFEIETDPKNHDYIVKIGAEKKTETWDASENGAIEFMSEETAQKIAEDPFFRLEHATADKEKAEEAAPTLELLQDLRDSRSNDYQMSCILRKKFRTQKKEDEKLLQDGKKLGFSFALLPSSSADAESASVAFDSIKSDPNLWKKRKLDIKAASIFGKPQEHSEKLKQIKASNTLKLATPPPQKRAPVSWKPRIVPVAKTDSSIS